MELSHFVFLIGSLACPIAMCTTMWLISRHMNRRSNQPISNSSTPASLAERLALLRAQQQALEAEIAEVTRLMELEVQPKEILTGKASTLIKTNSSAVQSID